MGINFPATPTVGQRHPTPPVAGIPVYTWDGEKWTTVGGSIAAYAPPADAVPLVNAGAGLVGTSTDYAREDHVHPTDTSRASYDAMAYSGMQINGGMEVSQETGTGGTVTAGAYAVDGWKLSYSGTMVVGAAQGVVTTKFPGFPTYLFANLGTAQPSLGANDYAMISQPIEGYRIARLAWGTASAQPITIGFWTAHHRTGLYSVNFYNSANSRSYMTTYTQTAADVPQYNVITVPGDTAGTWATDNTTGVVVQFTLACGTGVYIAPSTNTWMPQNYVAASGQVNAVGAANDYFALTGVTVLPGTQAPTAAQSPNIMRPYDQELVTCMRYYEILNNNASPGFTLASAVLTGSNSTAMWQFHVRKRSTPTFALAPGANWANTTPPVIAASIDQVFFQNSGNYFYLQGGTNLASADARL